MGSTVRRKICIVTPSYVSSAPRVVKEADALHKAGFEVRVVFSQGDLQQVRQHDDILLKTVLWKWNSVRFSSGAKGEAWTYHKSRIRQHAARKLSVIGLQDKLAEYAEGRIYGELAKLAAREKADLYIGHCPTGLAAAGYAAKGWNAKLGFDIEDFHTGEYTEAEFQPGRVEAIKAIESRYLPLCDHVSAVSDGVADRIRELYKVRRPVTIHNTFPLNERSQIDGKTKDRIDRSRLSLYWYSQTLGEGRGIEDAIRALGLLGGKAELHLRGNASGDTESRLKEMAREAGVTDYIYFHPLVPPTELLSRTAEHDVGLALEQPVCENRMLTVTNKLFFYFIAGLAVAATNTKGQQSVVETCPAAGFVYPAGDYKTLASEITKIIDNPGLIQTRKDASLEAARQRWNWERESEKLVEAVKEALA